MNCTNLVAAENVALRLDWARYASVYQQCLAEIDALLSLFDQGTGLCPASGWIEAQDRMAELKAKFAGREQEWKGLEPEAVLRDANCRLNVRANSCPGVAWSCALNDARETFALLLS